MPNIEVNVDIYTDDLPEEASYEGSINMDVEADIDVDDFLRECSTKDIEEIIDILIDDHYIEPKQVISQTSDNILDYEWQDILSNLETNRLRISNEDEEIIKRISKKY